MTKCASWNPKSRKQLCLYKPESFKETDCVLLCRLKVTKVTVKPEKIGKQIDTVNNNAITVSCYKNGT